MKIIIDISNNLYETISNDKYGVHEGRIYDIIRNGTPFNEVLDKIITEIEENVLESLSDCGDDWFAAEKVNDCLEIIEKYRAGSEET